MENQTSKSRVFYRPELDLLRLLAFLLVFLHHGLAATNKPLLKPFALGAACGLQIFFLLSAYLITELMLREIEATGTIHVPAFFVRRILRIWPLYFVFVISYLIYSLATHAAATVIHGLIAYLLVCGNWFTYFHGFLPAVVLPLWSISLEEQFYLVWPTAVVIGKHLAVWLLSFLSIAGSYLALLYLGDGHHNAVAIGTNGFVEFQFFGIGALLALLLHKRNYRPPMFLRLSLFALAVAAVVTSQSVFHLSRSDNAFPQTLIPAFALLALGSVACFLGFYALTVPQSFQPLLYLGRISYGLYVFHMLAYVCARTILAPYLQGFTYAVVQVSISLVLTIAFASISYRLLELPFLRLKKRFTFAASRSG